MPTELEKWFDAVVRDATPGAFTGVDLDEARRQIANLATLVTQPPEEPFSVRDNMGGSGQSDSS